MKAAPALQKSVDERFAAFDAALAPYREGEGFKPAPLDEARRKALAEPVRAAGRGTGQGECRARPGMRLPPTDLS